MRKENEEKNYFFPRKILNMNKKLYKQCLTAETLEKRAVEPKTQQRLDFETQEKRAIYSTEENEL